MNKLPLTPTHAGSHAQAKHLLKAKAALKKLLSVSDLKFLLDEKKRTQWVAAAPQKNSDADRFLEGLGIEKWDIEEFVDLLRTRGNWSLDDDFAQWLSNKSLDWHQELYALLYKELGANDSLEQLRSAAIVRINNGSYKHGGECYFPSDGNEHDDVHPRVDARVYTSGKNKAQQIDAKNCLVQLGVGEVGEAEEVKSILENRYTQDATSSPQLRTILRITKT